MRLRRFLISEPMAALTLGAVTPWTQNASQSGLPFGTKHLAFAVNIE
jgi:hypothetical protein